ncbi:MAG: Hsp20/alpha crystallin family protein [SAR202 cluster bacterium]|nr:Hsp20/alpha crystallin family protein [SAR202 cluster bacterium]
MVMQRFDPISELRRMDDTINRLWRGRHTGELSDGGEAWAVPMDVYQEGDNIVVKASLPGVEPEKVQITLEDGIMTLKAETGQEQERQEGGYLMRERRSGSFYRALRLPDTVDTDRAETTYENGVLTVHLPKQESKKAKTLQINARGQRTSPNMTSGNSKGGESTR